MRGRSTASTTGKTGAGGGVGGVGAGPSGGAASSGSSSSGAGGSATSAVSGTASVAAPGSLSSFRCDSSAASSFRESALAPWVASASCVLAFGASADGGSSGTVGTGTAAGGTATAGSGAASAGAAATEGAAAGVAAAALPPALALLSIARGRAAFTRRPRPRPRPVAGARRKGVGELSAPSVAHGRLKHAASSVPGLPVFASASPAGNWALLSTGAGLSSAAMGAWHCCPNPPAPR
mmetsp:Transcript_64078/g.171046  ORF Transcript_64078/g.171046 Transcript_64078/m.171046 type:complete len:237 (+) Transcript_64078:695-1405(+)